MNLRDELGIASANELRHVGSRTKGTMGQTEINEYEEISPPRARWSQSTSSRSIQTCGASTRNAPSRSRSSLNRSENGRERINAWILKHGRTLGGLCGIGAAIAYCFDLKPFGIALAGGALVLVVSAERAKSNT
ncbi:MAG: hypothetical protein V4793_04395 [Paraburkholderia tropica]|uniref:hypothetical protein n=1 Tax=Burkholderia gladioli TaxID=28095 RepID=UPI00163FB59B|nr:hypothetical protein [Burkholderia gladioli]